ncbi:MAG: HAD hydrolase-like protein [Dehalococcoidia bacterium]|nr:HAD hydrolase-like protein [Dehalococcoidia bacterium]
MIPSYIDIEAIFDHYDAVFFDAYGVLVDGIDALPNAEQLVNIMNASAMNYFIVTNDASKSIQSLSNKFQSQGMRIPVERIVNSGSLISGYYRDEDLVGRPTLVLGTKDSRTYVSGSCAKILSLDSNSEPDVILFTHSSPYDWESTLKHLLNLVSKRFKQKKPVRMVLPNTDFIYQDGKADFGMGAAAFVETLEEALMRLHGKHEVLRAAKLGKPHPPIFTEAILRAGSNNAIMIGDQLETDILGANNVGLDSAVVTTGINKRSNPKEFKDMPDDLTPRYILTSLV